MSKRFFPWLTLAILSLMGGVASWLCGCVVGEGSHEPDCPSFYDYQIDPKDGDQNTEFVIVVILRDEEKNRYIRRMRAQFRTLDGEYTGQSMDLIPSHLDWRRYFRTFNASDYCESGICRYYLKINALQNSGCTSTFNTDSFSIEITSSDDDIIDDDSVTDDDEAGDDDASNDDIGDDDSARE